MRVARRRNALDSSSRREEVGHSDGISMTRLSTGSEELSLLWFAAVRQIINSVSSRT